jgi:hypothetical protein
VTVAARETELRQPLGWRFYTCMAGQLVSNLGDQIMNLAAGLLIAAAIGWFGGLRHS